MSTRSVFRPPTQSTSPGVGITRIATSTTAAVFDLAASGSDFFGKRLRLMNESTTAGDAIYVMFAASDFSAVSAAASAGSTIAGGTIAANGFKLLPGATLDVELSASSHRYLHVDALANTPVLAIYPLSDGVGG